MLVPLGKTPAINRVAVPYPNEMSEMAMAHTVDDKVEAAYRRSDMREKRRRMMADWAAFCGGKAVGGKNVVAIGGRK